MNFESQHSCMHVAFCFSVCPCWTNQKNELWMIFEWNQGVRTSDDFLWLHGDVKFWTGQNTLHISCYVPPSQAFWWVGIMKGFDHSSMPFRKGFCLILGIVTVLLHTYFPHPTNLGGAVMLNLDPIIYVPLKQIFQDHSELRREPNGKSITILLQVLFCISRIMTDNLKVFMQGKFW